MNSVVDSSRDRWADLARTLVLASDEQAAFDTIVREVSHVLGGVAWIVDTTGDRLTVLASAHDTRVIRSTDARPTADAIAAAFLAVGDAPVHLGDWTAIPLDSGERRIVLVVSRGADDASNRLAAIAAWLPTTIALVRERTGRSDADRRLVDAYKLARRAGRTEGIDWVARQLADQAARALGAERVAVAAFMPDEGRLRVVATCGYPLASVAEQRIAAGDWVLGHVFASRRAIVARDVRRLRRLTDAARRYRTFSFAAVPIPVGRMAVGVLSATDKRDAAPFTREDVVTLRALSGVAGLGFAASRATAEATSLARAATVDSLTGLFNRRFFDARLLQELERARRGSMRPTVLIIDIDDFKAVNDSHGHQAGDAVLKTVARIVFSSVRVFDVCARYGGDEIAVIMPNSDPASALACAERIRNRIAGSDGPRVGARGVTVSIGVAVADAADTPDRVVRRADECLYAAKNSGKNCVRSAPRPRLSPAAPHEA